MTKITIENYEAFFLDYIEGNLDDATMHEVEYFLVLHPDLKDELEQASSLPLVEESFTFQGKNTLKKFQFENQPINAITFGDFCLAAHEGLLSEKKREELAHFMQTDNKFVTEYIAYGKTILKPDDIVYTFKDRLYREVRLVKFRILLMWGSVAAGLILLIAIYSGFFNTKEVQQPVVVYKVSPDSKITQPKATIADEVTSAVPVKAVKPQRSLIINPENSPEKINLADEVSVEEQETEIPDTQVIELASLIEPDLTEHNDTMIFPEAEIFEAATSENKDNESHKLLALIDEGVEKINKVTKSDNLDLAYKTSPSGEIKSFSIKLGFLGFERKKARN